MAILWMKYYRTYGNSVNPINVVVRNTFLHNVSMFGINDRKSVLLLSNTTLILVWIQ